MTDHEKRASELARLESHCLRDILDRDGLEACESAARKLLVSTATTYALITSSERLAEVFRTIATVQDANVLS